MNPLTATPSSTPAFQLLGLSVWIHGREFPESTEFWDANWLNVTAVYETSGARVAAQGPFLRADELAGFAGELERLYRELRGGAKLNTREPNLSVVLAVESLGQIDMHTSLTPNPMSESHTFEDRLDQTYLPPLIKALTSILEDFPIVGDPSS